MVHYRQVLILIIFPFINSSGLLLLKGPFRNVVIIFSRHRDISVLQVLNFFVAKICCSEIGKGPWIYRTSREVHRSLCSSNTIKAWNWFKFYFLTMLKPELWAPRSAYESIVVFKNKGISLGVKGEAGTCLETRVRTH